MTPDRFYPQVAISLQADGINVAGVGCPPNLLLKGSLRIIVKPRQTYFHHAPLSEIPPLVEHHVLIADDVELTLLPLN